MKQMITLFKESFTPFLFEIIYILSNFLMKLLFFFPRPSNVFCF